MEPNRADTPFTPDSPDNSVPQPQVINPGAYDAQSQPAAVNTEPMASADQVPPAAFMGGTAVAGGGNPRGKRWLLPVIIAVVVIVLLGGGFVFGYYLPNQPSNVFKSSLHNSGEALDKLVSYSSKQAEAKPKATVYSADVTAKSPEASFDATLKGSADAEGNSDTTVNANVLGEKIGVNFKTIVAKSGQTPDLYLQVSGVKSYLDSYGLTSLSSLDGQWIAIDHTVLDSYAANAAASAGDNVDSSNFKSPTTEQLNDAFAKMQQVNKDYIFTTNGDKAVLKNQKYLGKETQDGRSVYHYQAGYNKDHLQAYVDALGKALDSSKLNDWSKQVNSGKSLSSAMDLKSAKQSIKDANSNYTFDVWSDTKTKLIHSVRFGDPSDKTSFLTITQNYTSGDDYPFTLKVTGKDDSDNDTTATVTLTLDTKSNAVSGKFTYEGGANKSETFSGNYSIKPSNEAVKVTAPTNTKSFAEVLSQLGFGNYSANASDDTLTSTSASSDLFTLSQ